MIWGFKGQKNAILPKTISSAAKYITPCLFSATHWYMPASDSVSADTDSTPSSTWILSCEEQDEKSNYFSSHKGSCCFAEPHTVDLEALSMDLMLLQWMSQWEEKSHFCFLNKLVLAIRKAIFKASCRQWKPCVSYSLFGRINVQFWSITQKNLACMVAHWEI